MNVRATLRDRGFIQKLPTSLAIGDTVCIDGHLAEYEFVQDICDGEMHCRILSMAVGEMSLTDVDLRKMFGKQALADAEEVALRWWDDQPQHEYLEAAE